MSIPAPHEVLLEAIKVLDSLGISYMVGGSFASGVYGIPRMTQDADIVADIKLNHISDLVNRLHGHFYIDPSMIQAAIINRSSFNLIHLESMFKIDIFIPQNRAFDKVEFSRRRKERLVEEDKTMVYLISPEDIILTKLEWYRRGKEVSDRQYRDVLGVVQVQDRGSRLDWDYLYKWAEELGVRDLLEKIRGEVVD